MAILICQDIKNGTYPLTPPKRNKDNKIATDRGNDKIEGMEDKNKEKLDFMYEVLHEKIERQNDDFNSLISKGSFLFGFVGTLIASYFGFVFTGNISIWWNIPSILLAMATLYSSIHILRVRTYKDPPPINEFYKNETLAMTINDIKNKTLASMSDCFKANEENLIDMADWFTKGLWLLFFTFVTILMFNTFAYGIKQEATSKQHQCQYTTTARKTCRR